jgi:hypothetical protein
MAAVTGLRRLRVALAISASARNVTSRHDGPRSSLRRTWAHAEVVRTLIAYSAPLDHRWNRSPAPKATGRAAGQRSRSACGKPATPAMAKSPARRAISANQTMSRKRGVSIATKISSGVRRGGARG